MWNLKKPKKNNSWKQSVDWCLPGVEEMGEGGQTFSYKMNKFWGSNVYMVIIVNNTVLCT